jgi:riboflavin kinase/FMN adenylyltransferase
VPGVVIALGNFDGVHLGHQAVIRRVVEEALGHGMRSLAATFEDRKSVV